MDTKPASTNVATEAVVNTANEEDETILREKLLERMQSKK